MLTQEHPAFTTPRPEIEPQVLTETAFTRLLEWLDDGTDSQGETYLEIRRRLVAYFDRRGRLNADALADETLNRIARTLEHEEIQTRPPARYCYVVARFVLLEDIRVSRRSVPFDEGRPPTARDLAVAAEVEAAASEREHRLTCLDRCLAQLKAEHRDLVVQYYRDAKRQRIERRRSLAASLGITMNALGIRLSRLRATLQLCVRGCSSAES